MSLRLSNIPVVRESGFEVNIPASFATKLKEYEWSAFRPTPCIAIHKFVQNCDKRSLFLIMQDFSRWIYKL